MWKKIGFISIIILTSFFMGTVGINGQEIPSIQMMLSPQLQQGLQVIQISNLDILDQQAALYLFDIEIYNVLEDWENSRMIFQIEKDDQIIASIESDPFILTAPQPQPPPGSPAYVANNIDLLSTGPNSSACSCSATIRRAGWVKPRCPTAPSGCSATTAGAACRSPSSSGSNMCRSVRRLNSISAPIPK